MVALRATELARGRNAPILSCIPLLTVGGALVGWRGLRGAAWVAPPFALGEWLALAALNGGEPGVWPLGLLFIALTHAPALGIGLVLSRRASAQDSRS